MCLNGKNTCFINSYASYSPFNPIFKLSIILPESPKECYNSKTVKFTMFTGIFSDNELINYINGNLSDPWIGTSFEGYVFLSPKQKGEFGEKFISKYFSIIKKSNVQKPTNSGHDRIVDNIKTEFKFSLSTRDKKSGVKKDQFIINHISKDKDWERLVFFGINFNENDSRILWFTKDDFLNYLECEDCIFNHQQGGKSIKNDDYICTKVDKLLKLSFIKSIDQW